MKLYPYQKTAIKFAKQYPKAFIQAPTGSGKSVMIAYLAKEYVKQGKKVIISTNTNQLALELLGTLDTIHNNFFNIFSAKDKAVTDIVVGKNNYLDVDNLDFGLLSKFTNSTQIIEELNSLINTTKNKDYLVDIFLNRLDLSEEEKETLSKLLATSEKKDYIKDFNEVDIAVTNHYYLIYKALFTKFDFSNYVILFDEVHQVSDAIENIFTKSFSLFRFRFLLNRINNELKFLSFRGSKTLLKQLQKLSVTVNDLFNITSNEKLAGISFINDEKQIKNINKIIKHLTKKEFLNIKTKLEKTELPLNNKKLKNLLLDEWDELLEIATVMPKEIAIYYSPEKGYLRLSATTGNFYNALKSFWEHFSEYKGFSATLTIPNDERYFEKRLNLPISPAFYDIPPVFSHSQIEYFIADKDFKPPKVTDESIDIEWIKELGNFIIKTYNNKNSLVLMGGYLEVETLFEYINSLNPDIPVMKAERKKSPYRLIEKFKNQGGIFIATRNFGTGIDLKGALLENLYIAKLPYPVMGTKRWINLKLLDKAKKTNYTYFLATNEMLINLKQWIGRLIRSKEDKGNLYLLDSRINKPDVKNKVTRLIKEMFR